MKLIQTNQKFKGKSIPAYGFLKTQEKLWANQKYRYYCQMFVIPKTKNHTIG